MHDQDDRETHPDTLAPVSTPDEEPTNPSMRAAMFPPSVQHPSIDSLLMQAISDVAGAAKVIRTEREERRAFEVSQLSAQAEILAAIERADRNGNRNYEMLRDEIRHLKDSDRKQEKRLADGEERFERIERSIEALREELLALVARATEDTSRRIAALETELAEARNAARQAPPTPA